MIHRIEATGYRLLDGFSAEFGDLTIIIGANATGKSTLFDLLNRTKLSLEFPLIDVINVNETRSAVEHSESKPIKWQLTFTCPKTAAWRETPLADGQTLVYEVELTADKFNQPTVVSECLRNTEPYPGHEQPLKFLDARNGQALVYDKKVEQLVRFDAPSSDDTDDRTERSGPVDDSLAQTQEKDKRLLLSKMRFLNDYPVASLSRIILQGGAHYPGFNVSPNAPIRTKPSEIRRETILAATGDNLGTVLHEFWLQPECRTALDELNDFIAAAYPEFESVYPETAFGSPPGVLFRVKEHTLKRPMEPWELSDGFLRFLCLAFALLNPKPPSLITVDEPEVGLHPRLLPIVADMIKTASERTQVIVSTHSPDLLDYFDLDSIAVMTREEGHAQWNRPGTQESLGKMLESVTGITLGDLHRSGELEAVS
jgi:predicted ATPase